MTFEAFITRTNDGREVDYDKDFERDPVIQIAQALYEQFNSGPKYYALLANLELPTGHADHTRQIDALILSEDGLGVLDFKNAHAPFTPTLDERPWLYTNGKPVVSGSRKNANPYMQIVGQREAVYQKLTELPTYINESELPKPLREHAQRNLKRKKANKQFYHFEIAARCVLTGVRFEIPHYKRQSHQRWFDIMWLDEAPRFAKTLSFNKGLRLSPHLLRTIIHDLFAVSPWIELESLYRKPFAYLQRMDVETGTREPLLSTTVTLGRSTDLAVRIAPNNKHVSRNHARIRQTPDGAVIADLNSTNGTWVNGAQVIPGSERVLNHDDRITLGKMIDGQPSDQSVVFRYINPILANYASDEFDETVQINLSDDPPMDSPELPRL